MRNLAEIEITESCDNFSKPANMDRPRCNALPSRERVTTCVKTPVTVYFLGDLPGFGLFATH